MDRRGKIYQCGKKSENWRFINYILVKNLLSINAVFICTKIICSERLQEYSLIQKSSSKNCFSDSWYKLKQKLTRSAGEVGPARRWPWKSGKRPTIRLSCWRRAEKNKLCAIDPVFKDTHSTGEARWATWLVCRLYLTLQNVANKIKT